MISGFFSPSCFGFGVPVRREVYFLGSSVFFEGLLCGRPFAGSPGASDPQGPPWESCFSSGPLVADIKYNMVAMKEGLEVSLGKGVSQSLQAVL